MSPARSRFPAPDSKCEHDGCDEDAAYEVSTSFLPWIKLCLHHRREWHRLTYREMELVSDNRRVA